MPTAGKYVAAFVLTEPNSFVKSTSGNGEYFYRGNKVVGLYNSQNPSRFGSGIHPNSGTKEMAVLEIDGKRYSYYYVEAATLPSIQLRTVEKELTYKPFNDEYPQISGVLEATAGLGFTKQIPVVNGKLEYTNIYPRTRVTFE